MATTELKARSAPTRARWAARDCVLVYLILCATTLAAAVAVILLEDGGPVRELLRARLTPQSGTGGLGGLALLALHNFGICAGPLLLPALICPQGRWARIGDAVVATSLLVNAALVGSAIAAYGPALIPYVPQLPVEWAALSLGAGGWLLMRRRPYVPHRYLLRFVPPLAALVLLAAALEVFVTPHLR